MDNHPVDRGGELITRNRLLLARAAEARVWAQDAIERVKDVVQSTMEVRLAWARVRQGRWDDRPQSPDSP
jgi:hypothetical protein